LLLREGNTIEQVLIVVTTCLYFYNYIEFTLNLYPGLFFRKVSRRQVDAKFVIEVCGNKGFLRKLAALIKSSKDCKFAIYRNNRFRKDRQLRKSNFSWK